MQQLSIVFEEADIKSKFKPRLEYFNSRINNEGLPYDVIAINHVKGNEALIVVYDREKEGAYYLSIYENEIKHKRSAHNPEGYGYNFTVIDNRFTNKQSFLLTNKKKELTSCSREQLEDFAAKGWQALK